MVRAHPTHRKRLKPNRTATQHTLIFIKSPLARAAYPPQQAAGACGVAAPHGLAAAHGWPQPMWSLEPTGSPAPMGSPPLMGSPQPIVSAHLINLVDAGSLKIGGQWSVRAPKSPPDAATAYSPQRRTPRFVPYATRACLANARQCPPPTQPAWLYARDMDTDSRAGEQRFGNEAGNAVGGLFRRVRFCVFFQPVIVLEVFQRMRRVLRLHPWKFV